MAKDDALKSVGQPIPPGAPQAPATAQAPKPAGLPSRAEIAARVLTGHKLSELIVDGKHEKAADHAVRAADALLARLQK